jgi:hypothetical protein
MRSLLALPLALLCAAAPFSARADTVVVPNAYESQEAPGLFVFPFATSQVSNYPVRYQQVYGATEFPALGDVMTISELRFRIDYATGDRNPFEVEQVEVRLSTTAAAPDALGAGSTAALDGNVGLDETLVYTGGLSWNACGTQLCPPEPAPFDLAIVFSEPFVYDPTAGNLLLEVVNGSESYPIQTFDAVNATDAISNAREVRDRDDGTPLFPSDTYGLVTQFVYTVPEPGSLGATLAALLAVAGLRSRRA